jgi:hypothetical protein
MDLQHLIKEHGLLLDCQVQEDPALCEKLKQLGLGKKRQKKPSGSLVSLVSVYSLMVAAFTFVNIQLVGMLKKEPPQPKSASLQTAEIFRPTFPGSFSQAVEEVTLWHE